MSNQNQDKTQTKPLAYFPRITPFWYQIYAIRTGGNPLSDSHIEHFLFRVFMAVCK